MRPEVRDEIRQAVLCYVSGHFAWFTTKPLAEQWGDDWNDAPYEHNAEEPYGPTVFHNSDGTASKDPKDWHENGLPKFEIIKVAWDGSFEAPCELNNSGNSPYSVQDINAGRVPWLQTPRYLSRLPVVIPAGTTLERFEQLIEKGGGQVYMPQMSQKSVRGEKLVLNPEIGAEEEK